MVDYVVLSRDKSYFAKKKTHSETDMFIHNILDVFD
jgi:hypothetical protein